MRASGARASMSMSPQVSQPRRRLPTGEARAGLRSAAARAIASATAVASASRWRPASASLLEALRISASFFGPIPASRGRGPSRRPAPGRRGFAMPSIASRAVLPSSGPTPCRRRRSRIVGGNSWRGRDGTRQPPVSAISRMRAARSLPIPGNSRRPASVESGERMGMVGRCRRRSIGPILNGFSPLISSRSAISPRTRAMARLSKQKPLCFDAKSRIRAPPAARASAMAPRVRRAVAEQATAAAGAAHLGRRRARRIARAISVVDGGVVTPGARRFRFSHSVAIGRPTSSQSPRSSAWRMRGGGVADRSKQSKICAVAVEMALRDFPVVGARVARRARVHEDDARAAAPEVDSKRVRCDAGDAQFHGGDAAVQRRTVVLDPVGTPMVWHSTFMATRAGPPGRTCAGSTGPAHRRPRWSAPTTRRCPAPAGDSPRVVSVAPRAEVPGEQRQQRQTPTRRSSRSPAPRPSRPLSIGRHVDAAVVARASTRAWPAG